MLISAATAELLSETLSDSVTLRDLGLHRLKDLGRPEQVSQLEAEFLEPSFPPFGSLDSPELQNNLPGLLITLTGAGGNGKTRLALRLPTSSWTEPQMAFGLPSSRRSLKPSWSLGPSRRCSGCPTRAGSRCSTWSPRR